MLKCIPEEKGSASCSGYPTSQCSCRRCPAGYMEDHSNGNFRCYRCPAGQVFDNGKCWSASACAAGSERRCVNDACGCYTAPAGAQLVERHAVHVATCSNGLFVSQENGRANCYTCPVGTQRASSEQRGAVMCFPEPEYACFKCLGAREELRGQTCYTAPENYNLMDWSEVKCCGGAPASCEAARNVSCGDMSTAQESRCPNGPSHTLLPLCFLPAPSNKPLMNVMNVPWGIHG